MADVKVEVELRRAVCEALGWQIRKRNGLFDCVTADGNAVDARCWVSPEQAWPHVDTDPAVSEQMLDEVCKEQGWYWAVCATPALFTERNKSHHCEIRRNHDGRSKSLIAEAFVETPSLARAKALLQALREAGKEGK